MLIGVAMNIQMFQSEDRQIFSKCRNFLEKQPSKLFDNEQEGFYSFILRYLTSLDFSETHARQYYYKIMQHKTEMSKKLGRNVGFRVSALDYFHNIEQELQDPKIIEIDLFEKLLVSTKTDPKTGCYHLNFFKQMVETEIARANRYKHNLSIMMLDIDDFKQINDRFGHEEADRLLKEFVTEIQSSLRTEDVLGRYGGDEFIILLPHTGRIGARVMAERIRESLANRFKMTSNPDHPVSLTFSGGISTYPYDAKEVDSLIKHADQSLYRSKHLGKNRVYDYLEEKYTVDKDSEKRKTFRYPLNPPMPIHLKDSSGIMHISGQALNVSASGILIECLCEVNEEILSSNLTFQINQLIEQQDPSFQITGNVVRLDRNQRNYKFHIALQFDKEHQTKTWENLSQLLPLSPVTCSAP